MSDFLQGSNRVIFPCLTDTPEIRQQKEKLIFAEISNLDDVEFLIALINEDIDSEMSNQDLQNMTIIFARIWWIYINVEQSYEHFYNYATSFVKNRLSDILSHEETFIPTLNDQQILADFMTGENEEEIEFFSIDEDEEDADEFGLTDEDESLDHSRKAE